ncbi:MAG: MBL fold metallo-hydrolase [Bacteroidetes bacterium]|nr:MBL fold metallo-hydrolase [Bacteroidota bacterium]
MVGRGTGQEDSTCLQVRRLVVGSSQTNCYLLVCPSTLESVILDPGAEAEKILQRAQPTRVKYILLTHGHGDHTGALEEVQWKTAAPMGAHPADADRLPCAPDLALEDGERVRFGEVELKVIHVPGHTPGSIALLAGSRLFGGDTVFPGGPGHTRSPEDFQQIVASIRDRILPLPDVTRVLPGHGAGTTVREVREEYVAFEAREGTDGLFGDVLWRG